MEIPDTPIFTALPTAVLVYTRTAHIDCPSCGGRQRWNGAKPKSLPDVGDLLACVECGVKFTIGSDTLDATA